MRLIKNIEKKEYEEFVLNSNYSHFMKSYIWGEVMRFKNFTPHYVGLKDDNKLVATALLLEKKLYGKYKYFYCPRGYTIDYENVDLLNEFTNKLKAYCKKNNAIFIKIDPDIKRHNLDVDGNILTQENPLINTLLSMGYKHKGYNLDFSSEQPRFTFRLDINKDWDEVYSNFHATTRKIFNKGNEYNLDLFIGDENNIKDFYQVMEETSVREDFVCNTLNYYKNFYKLLKKDNLTDLYVVKINIKDLEKVYLNKIDIINNKIINIDNNQNKNIKKSENMKKELIAELEHLTKDLSNVQEIKESELVLSSIMTVKYKDTVWTLHGGNSNCLKQLNPNYYIYYNIIKDAHDNGYKRMDFFGTSGIANPPKDNPIYGIHSFKKRLGGEYTEFIGEYDLVCNKFLYTAFNLLVPIRRKLISKKIKRGRK